MTPDISTHLTDEALDDVLIGLGSFEAEAHLARCLQCRSRVESFRADVALFNAASMAWSESRPQRPARASLRHSGDPIRFAFVSWSAVAALLLITAVAVWRHSVVSPPNHVNIVESQPVDSEAQIAQDNQLLQEINAAISSDDESPIEEYNLREHSQARLKPHSQ
jgi:hypothetical protein